MLQSVTVVFFFILGFIYLYPLIDKLSFPVAASLSPFIGMTIWAIHIILLGIFTYKIDNGGILIGASLSTSLIAMLIYWFRTRWKLNISHLFGICVVLIAVFLLSTVIQSFESPVFFTGDSIRIIDMGRFWINESLGPEEVSYLSDWSDGELTHGLGMFGVFLPTLEAASIYTEGVFVAYLPIVAVSFIICFLLMQRNILLTLFSFSHKIINLLLVSQFFVYISTYGFLLHMRYLHTNIFVSMYLSLSVIFFIYYRLTDEKLWFKISAILLIAVAFSRTETPIVVIAIIIIYITTTAIPIKLAFQTFSPILALIASWNFYIFWDLSTFGLTKRFVLTPKIALFFAIVSILTIPAIFLFEKFFSSYRSKFNQLFILFWITILLFGFGSAIGLPNYLDFYINIALHWGLWGATWIGIFFILVILRLETKNEPEIEILYQIGMGGILFVLSLAVFKEYTLRVGWASSGNRLLIHTFPILITYLSFSTAYLYKKHKSEIDAIQT